MAIGSYAVNSNQQCLTCYHCGQAVEDGIDIHCEIETAPQQFSQQSFCCHGCLAVCELIHSGGLQDYYKNRDHFANKVLTRKPEFVEFDNVGFQESFCTLVDDRTRACKFFVDGLHCSACVWLIEKSLRKLEGIENIRVSLLDSSLEFQWQTDKILLSKVLTLVSDLGYLPSLWLENENRSRQQLKLKSLLRRTGLSGLLMMQVGMFSIALYAGKGRDMSLEYQYLLQGFSLLLATTSLVFAGKSFFLSAWNSLRAAQINMDVPISCALTAAWLGSLISTFRAHGEVYFDSICMFIFLLNAVRYFELKSRLRHANIDNQVELPEHCRVLKNQGPNIFENLSYDFVPAITIQPGEKIYVKRGEMLALDGKLLSPRALVNEANINGEFLPVEKTVGDNILSGTINESDAFIYEISQSADHSCMQNIQKRASALRSERPRFLSISDKIAAWFSTFVLLASIAAALIWIQVDAGKSLDVFIAMLVISCPCALSLAAPSAIAVSANFLRKKGVLLARSSAFELLPKINSLCLDKTGTLTKGMFSVTHCQHFPATPLTQISEIDGLATALQQFSEHPIAQAFSGLKGSMQSSHFSTLSNIQSHIANGMSAVWQHREWRIGRKEFCEVLCQQSLPQVNKESHATLVYLVNAHHCYAYYELEDQVRDNAKESLESLASLNKHILSGDRLSAVEQIATRLGIKNWKSDCSPENKQHYIANLQEAGSCVAMLGDGVNDLPVLAQADISIAMHSGNRLAQVDADCILLDNNLRALLTLFRQARKTLRVIKQNYFWALLYNSSALPLAALGLIPPWLAALGMSASSLLVVMNAARLSRERN